MKTEKESWTPFKFNEGAYGDTTPTRQTSFAGQGLISSGYQAPNYSTAGAGYSNDNFFGGNPNTYVNPWSAKFGQCETNSSKKKVCSYNEKWRIQEKKNESSKENNNEKTKNNNN